MKDSILRLVPYGEDLPGDVLRIEQVTDLLDKLVLALEQEGLKWDDVGLLLLANSKSASSHPLQNESDQSIRDALTAFCDSRKWHPSLIGSSVLSSFFHAKTGYRADISDGLLITAVISGAFDRIPVVHEINRELDERPLVGRRVLEKGIAAFKSKASQVGVDLSEDDITTTSTGVLLTTGSGHIRAEQAVNFKECYAIGQELLEAAEEHDAYIVGGCATNRSEEQLQLLYYSETVGPRLFYKSTYNHAAVFAFLPYARARLQLAHPYERDEDVGKLDITFHPLDEYEEGRSFYVEEINGQSAFDFLANYWPYTPEQLNEIVERRLAIPREPDAHWVTIASSLSKRDKQIWPNIPVWLEVIDGRVMMRMVRAEDDDANYYLMRLKHEALRENARDLMATLRASPGEDVSMLTFLCESRKYVLNQMKSNAEAKEMINTAPPESCIVGLYLNGEYSTGVRKSIGYHNYSQIGALMARRPIADLHPDYLKSRLTVELFPCHANANKHTVKFFLDAVRGHLGTKVWLDEHELIVGDVLAEKLQPVVGRGGQFVVPFISDLSVDSEWVRDELRWAFEQEEIQKRTIVLPVVVDERGDHVIGMLRERWPDDLVSKLTERVYLQLNDYSDDETALKAKQMADDIIRRLALGSDSGSDAPNPFRHLERPSD